MRILLLPISTRTSLLYCHRLPKDPVPGSRIPYSERLTTYAAKKWHEWEHAEKGWPKYVTNYGNRALKRVPHEEWGLKSVPPLSKQRRERELQAAKEGRAGTIVNVEWPEGFTTEREVMALLERMGGAEKRGFHRKWLIWSVVGMPVTAPVALVPIIPNFPFFYLLFRAWSHWRAYEGAKHIDFLLENRLTASRQSELMKRAYEVATLEASIRRLEEKLIAARGKTELVEERDKGEEEMILTKESGKIIAEMLDVPAVEVEIERAIWQVKRALNLKREPQAGKKEQEPGGRR